MNNIDEKFTKHDLKEILKFFYKEEEKIMLEFNEILLNLGNFIENKTEGSMFIAFFLKSDLDCLNYKLIHLHENYISETLMLLKNIHIKNETQLKWDMRKQQRELKKLLNIEKEDKKRSRL